MRPEWLEGTWLLALDWLIRLVALCWIPTRTTPGAARSWLLLVGFLPLLGLPLYLLFGHPWLSRLRIARQAQASMVIREQQAPLGTLRWTPRPDTAIDEIAPLVERQGDFMPTHGNAVAAFDRMGRPDSPSREQIVQLREAGKLAAPESVKANNGKFEITVPVQGLVVVELR